MTWTPKVSVVMPAYNAALYLDEAVTSILNQTLRDFEFIVINDGSTDDTVSILDKYERSDNRLRVYHQENQGMIPALNRGCRLARGKYIARMDADDVSFPGRLEKQVEYMEKHPEIGIVGTWLCVERDGLAAENWCPPTSSKVLKWDNFFGVCVSHPAVLMRRAIIERLNFYRPEALHGEDGDLWLRANSITEFGNVPEILLKYRVWHGSASQLLSQSRRDTHVRLLASFVKEFLNVEPPMEAVAGLRQLRIGPRFSDLRQIRLTAALIQKLYEKFMKENSVDAQERREIAWDAAKKLGSLAVQALRFNASSFVSLFMQAVRIDYRLVYPSAIMRGVGTYFRTSV